MMGINLVSKDGIYIVEVDNVELFRSRKRTLADQFLRDQLRENVIKMQQAEIERRASKAIAPVQDF